jgi:hypothetical protein
MENRQARSRSMGYGVGEFRTSRLETRELMALPGICSPAFGTKLPFIAVKTKSAFWGNVLQNTTVFGGAGSAVFFLPIPPCRWGAGSIEA